MGKESDLGARMNPHATLTLRIEQIPCFLCGESTDLRRDKNGKIYFICDSCGVQAFIRRRSGMERLNELGDQLKKNEIAQRVIGNRFLEIQSRVREIEQLREEISRIDEKLGIIFVDENLVRVKKSLENRLTNCISELEKVTANRGK